MTAVSPGELLALGVAAAECAGAELVERFGRTEAFATKSSATDPVSAADRAAEALLVEQLHAARPDDAILAEEGTDEAGPSGLRWVLDPLDGTVNYLYGLPAWAVSVACEDADGALIAVVCDPLHRETFTAIRGAGAWLGDRRLAVREPVELAQALIATGFSYDRERRRTQAEVVGRVLVAARDIRRGGSAALDLCALAAGRVDGYYEDGIAPWDWAAGGLIAAEAGAVVRPYGGGILAAGPSLVDELAATVG